MSLWMIPFILFWSAVGWIRDRIVELAPAIGITIGVVGAVVAVLSIVVLIGAPRPMLRSERRWVRAIGVVVAVVAALAAVGFALVAVVALVAVASFS